MKPNLTLFFIKLDRIASWVLLISVFTYFLTGYGQTKGVIDGRLAVQLHQEILPLIAISAFTIHTFYAVRLSFIRWRIWNKVIKALLILTYLTAISLLFYFELFYKPQFKSNAVKIQPASTLNNKPAETKAAEKIFTLEELSLYDGRNGNPAYAAVDGVVYDLSAVFTEGNHKGHPAGEELTEEFYSRHMIEEIRKYPIVGKLQ